jgi:ubiquinone/menaquinone biosynthesis C-methylase UbiE
MPEQLHSKRRLGDWRHHLWNADFLHLMAARLGLKSARNALDVGCGLGHWSDALRQVLDAKIQFVGVDREPEWVRRAHARAATVEGFSPAVFCAADAARMPFADASFDLVTCQTLLIHLSDPIAAITEMVRVLRPGGALLLAEPNNLAQRSTYGSNQYDGALGRLPAAWRLQYFCERGKRALRQGFNSIGDMLPGWLAQIGLADIKVHLSDKTLPLVPPYDSAAAPEIVAALEQQVQSGQWTWTESEARSYFLAGGGGADEFDVLWQAVLAEQADILAAVRRGEYHSAGGFLMYLVSGRKAT